MLFRARMENYESLKFKDLATLGKAVQKVLKIYCLSKLAQVGSTTLFSRGTGKVPVKNSHYFYEIRSLVTPFSK